MKKKVEKLWNRVRAIGLAVEESNCAASWHAIQAEIIKAKPMILKSGAALHGGLGIALEDRLGEFVDRVETKGAPYLRNEFLSIRPSSFKTILSLLDDTLWNLCVEKVQRECPQCEELELEILFDPDSGSEVFSCTLCTRSETPGGKLWRGERLILLPPVPK